ncbi:conjugal transfer protein TraF [Halorhodospira halochloris]|uniref:conjugal transfer protein TraF n=1 Tax=Halorhodospira halochloris TaxID=1052 RepID=UPI001EE7ACA6|nr:conjugal transfer protein TraF [Halorhodospira halochloris]MCG5548454.1 conjugal transfer protein TraF [Halorhodospira halochloris]
MRKLLLPLFLGAALPGLALANPHAYPSGPNIGFGDSTALDRLQGNKKNPASPISDVRRGVRMGVIGFSLSYEIGDVEDIGDRFEEFEDSVDEFGDSLDEFDGISNNEDIDGLVELIEGGQRVQDSIVNLTDDLYLGLGIKGNVLPFPLEITSDTLRGSLFFDVDFDIRGNLSVHYGIPGDSPFSVLSTDTGDYHTDDDCNDFNGKPFCIDDDGNVYADSDPDNKIELDDEALGDPAALAQGAYTRTISIGYGTAVAQYPTGTLFAGGRLNHFEVELSRTASDFDDDMGDTLTDGYTSNQRQSTDFGLDAGLVWVSDWYQLGATLININTPSFAYHSVPQDCNGDSSCELLNDAIDRGDIERSQDYEMEPQLSLEAAAQTPGRNWLLSAALDANAVDGPFGEDYNDAYQWFTLGAAYQPSTALLPGARFGYRQNLAGSELSYLSGGFTLANFFSLDAAVSTDTVDSVPRGFMLSAGLETRF